VTARKPPGFGRLGASGMLGGIRDDAGLSAPRHYL